jgi:ribosomal-protein-alanine N-acetyltransferase
MQNYFYCDNLKSERLKTRFLTEADIHAWSEFFEDKDAVEFIPDFGLNTSAERARDWIDRQLNRYAKNLYGLQVLVDKRTNEFIGQCGLLLQEVDGIEEVEVGYHILRKHWGKGYAPEAARLFIDFAFGKNISSSVISIIDSKNLKSQRVAEKNGLIREKQTGWRNMNVFSYRISKNS